MRNVIAALAISIGASVILYSAATALGLPSEVAKGLAGLPAFATKNVYEFLEASSARRNLAEVGSESIASLDQFSIRPLFVFFLASVMFSGAMIVSGALMGGLFGIAYAVADRQ